MPGFTAALDKSVVSSNLNTVVFNRAVSSNIEASGYDTTTGVFTAYEDGTYIFHMHVLSDNNKVRRLHRICHLHVFLVSHGMRSCRCPLPVVSPTLLYVFRHFAVAI